MLKTALAAPLLALALVAHSSDKKAPAASKDLDRIKALAGDWKGTAVMEGKTVEIRTSFRVTAGGSAVVETMGAGTPHEMVNMYNLVDGKLVSTHYCAMGNAPLMRLVSSDDKAMRFEAVKANGIDPKKTPHMNSLAYAFDGKDGLTATWTAKNMGPEHEKPGVFAYKRVR